MNSCENFDAAALHPNAAKAIDGNGVELLRLATKRISQKSAPDPFPTRQEMDTITDKDIIGEVKMANTDLSGKTLARYFFKDGHEIGLFGEGYDSLRLLVEKIIKAKPFDCGLSSEFLEETVFDWWKESYEKGDPPSLSKRLLGDASIAVGNHHLIVPLSSLEVQQPFQFGDILVSPMDKQLIAEMAIRAKENNPEHIEVIDQKFKKLTADLGHLTGVEIRVFGEPRFAKDYAQRIAFQFAELVRFMSPAAVTWNVPYACYPHGCYSHRTTTILTISDGKISYISQGLVDRGLFNWRMTTGELRELMASGFANYAAVFQKRSLSEFELRIATSVGAFSEGVASANVGNRLIYVMSALEHLFLRNEQEPIQSGVADRIAFLIAKNPSERRDVVTNFKKAYALRSKQVHHLSSLYDEATLTTFFKNAWIAVLCAIQQMARFQKQADFIDAIENVKYGGGR